MKNKLILGILVLVLTFVLVIGGAYGCGNSAATEDTQAKSFIWKITSGSTHVYLLGSVHVAKADLYPLDSSIEDAYNSVDNLVVEVNANNMSQQKIQDYILTYGTYPSGDGIKNHLSESTYNELNKQMTAFGASLTLFNAFRPWVIYNVYSQFVIESLGYKAENGIDLYFMDKAAKTGLKILELETMESQLNLISSIDEPALIQTLEYDLTNSGNETIKELQNLFEAWSSGDVQAMEAITFNPLYKNPGMGPYYKVMYDDRNAKMLQKIEEYMAGNETYFVVVGAGHLVGNNGLVNLLQNKGYQVEQLNKSIKVGVN